MKNQCQAAVIYGPENMVIESVEIPDIGPNDILLQMMACSLCGSEVPVDEGAPTAECPLCGEIINL